FGSSNLGDEGARKQRLAMVVVSACLSGMAPSVGSAFSGVAQSLILHGIPAVVAMQLSVDVQAAGHFASRMYRAIGANRSLTIAMTDGRMGMNTSSNQWFRPVLYMRWRDNEGGRIFGPPRAGYIRPVPDRLLASLHLLVDRVEASVSKADM